MKVSWQVTGIPKDLWAKAHPMTVEQEKAASLVAISMPNSMASRKRKVFHLIYIGVSVGGGCPPNIEPPHCVDHGWRNIALSQVIGCGAVAGVSVCLDSK